MKILYIVVLPFALFLGGGSLGVFLWKAQYKPITPSEAIERIAGENKTAPAPDEEKK